MHPITKNGERVHVELQCKFARWYGKNIPNDNLLEIMVQTVKKKIYSQGANATYTSVQRAALTTQIQEEIKQNLQTQCNKKQSGSRRPDANKTSDILEMVTELNNAKIFDYIPGREFNSFPGLIDFSHVLKLLICMPGSQKTERDSRTKF